MGRMCMRFYCSYYDGPLEDSGLLQEDRDRIVEEAYSEIENLTEWPDPDEE